MLFIAIRAFANHAHEFSNILMRYEAIIINFLNKRIKKINFPPKKK